MSSKFKQSKEFYTHMLLLQQEAIISFYVSLYGLPELKDDMDSNAKEIVDEVNATFNQCALLSKQLGIDKIKKKYYGDTTFEVDVAEENSNG